MDVPNATAGDLRIPYRIDQRTGIDRRGDHKARLELALDAAGVGLWDWNVIADTLTWDARTCDIFGVPPRAQITYARFLELVVPADRDDVDREARGAFDPSGNGLFAREYRVTTPSGEPRIVSARGRVIFEGPLGARRAVRLIGTVLDVTETRRRDLERELALEALRSSEERYMLAARATDSVIWDWEPPTNRIVWSDGIIRVFGYEPSDASRDVAWWQARVHPDDRARVTAAVEQVQMAGGGSDWHAAYRFQRADGTYASVVDRGYVVRDEQGNAVRMIGAMEDETEREVLEERLRHAQKMEAVGQLAGGIAHDFNNLLTVITVNLEFARQALESVHPASADLQEISRAAERARDLVRQLLAFSRKQPLVLQHLDLSAVVRDAQSLLHRVIGEEITLDVHLAADLPPVRADRSQLEQVLMNLAVNARDAMLTPAHGLRGTGGTLQIDTALVELTAESVGDLPGITPGPAVRLRVRDTGHGMDEATRAHVFEPFYTTKGVGRGTGLGLATVFGIVQQSGGAIQLDSTLGVGTVFSIYFPVTNGDSLERISVADSARAATPRGGNVLLVEDERAVRVAARRMLEREGFTVFEARHGADALVLWRRVGQRIDVVVTDMRMPEMGGAELVHQLRREVPKLPVVFMSGYSEDDIGEFARNGDAAVTAFVEKPFTTERLMAAVSTVMAHV